MHSRHDIRDEDWNRIEALLPGRPGGHGGVVADNRLFVDAIRYLCKTGVAWRDLRYCYGNFNSVWQRYNRWCKAGVWERIAAALGDEDNGWLLADSTCVRAAPAAVGAKKSGRHGRAEGTGLWPRSRRVRQHPVPMNKGHAVVSPLGHPRAFVLTGAQANDSPHLPR